ncbi:MAG: PHP domain-containing protein [Phascolarctobacterium sp.]|nr:PHP domain-containing protein [Phascolarctobacterium sp.]
MFADLHMHSTFSDGRYTPTRLVDENYRVGVRLMALTDHDCVDGVREALEAAKKYHGEMQILAGVELGTECEHRPVHILGYNIDCSNEPLLKTIAWLRDSRENRLYKMIDKLASLGYYIKPEDCASEGKTIGRPHLAKALVKAGYFQGTQEAFDKLLHFGGPAYVPHAKLSPREAVELIHVAKGKAVLAHPTEIANDELALKLLDTIPFDGLEVYHPSARTKERQNVLKVWAIERKLFVTGGTDFHAIEDRFPNKIGIWLVNIDNVKGVLEWK